MHIHRNTLQASFYYFVSIPDGDMHQNRATIRSPLQKANVCISAQCTWVNN